VERLGEDLVKQSHFILAAAKSALGRRQIMQVRQSAWRIHT
jgi:hypothetical protein